MCRVMRGVVSLGAGTGVSRVVDRACGTGVGHAANASAERHAMRVICSDTHLSQGQAVDSMNAHSLGVRLSVVEE